jgi:Ca-activated chloride channel family protein
LDGRRLCVSTSGNGRRRSPPHDNRRTDHRGSHQKRTEAKQIYEQAKQKGIRTSLVEQERPNIFTTALANIGPGDHITVEIEYQETIRYDQNRFSLRFPTVVGPRYIPGVPDWVEHEQSNTVGRGWSFDTDRVPDASRITPPVRHPREGPVNPIHLALDLVPGFAVGNIASSSHPILVIPGEDNRHHIALRKESVPSDRDFELSWEPADSTHPSAASYAERTAGAGYALLMFMPPAAATHRALWRARRSPRPRPPCTQPLPISALPIVSTSSSSTA